MRALLLALALATSASAQTWQALPPMQTARAGAAVAVLDGQLVVMGGRDAAGQVLGTAERFDPTTQTWAFIAPLRDARADAAATVFEGRIVLLGGREDDGDVTDDVETYDAVGDAWDSFDHLLTSREGLGAVVLDGGLYAVGGASESGALLTTCEYYDSDWELYPAWTLSPGRARFGIAADGDAAVLAGGYSAFGPVADVSRYTIDGGSQSLPSLPSARGGLALVAHAETLYAVGGRDASDAVLADVTRFDPATQAWTAATPLPAPREGAGAAIVGTDLYVVGGSDALGTATATVYRLAGVATAAEDPAEASADALRLAGPNPFRHQTRLAVSLDAPAPGTIEVIDARGRRVALLHDGPLAAGRTTLAWTPGDLAPGLYSVRLTTARGVLTVTLSHIR